jgi:RNA polymerase sigma-70 factor (ECF subfamily)
VGPEEPIPTGADLWRQAEHLRALARALVADAGHGDDLAQDAWVAALERPRAAQESLAAWLAGALRHLARRTRRRERERPAVERQAAGPEAQEGPEEAVARAELLQRLGAAVLALDEPYRSAVILRHLDQLDPGEIARRQGCTREAARQRIARGLTELRRRLDAEHGARERWCLALAALARSPAPAPLPPTLTLLGGSLMTSKWLVAPVGSGVTVDVLPRLEQARDDLRVTFDSDGEARLDVEVVEGLEVTGRVTDSATGLPLAGATIGEGWTFRRTATSDGNGEYRLTGFGELGVYELYARARGYGQAADSPAIVDARHRRLDFALQPARAASGRLVDADGRPVSGAYVAAVGRGGPSEVDWSSAQSDAEGRFRCADLAASLRHALLVHHTHFATVVYDFPLEERTTPELELGTFVLRPPGLVAGRVLDAEGRGIAGATIELAGTNRDRRSLVTDPLASQEEVGESYVSQRETFTYEEGRFWFGGTPEGDFTLTARASGRAPLATTPLTLGPGERRSDVRLEFPVGGTLRGRVVDESAVGLGGVIVRAKPEPPQRGLRYEIATRTAPDGTFELRDLPAARYTLEVFPFIPGDVPGSSTLAPSLYSYLEHVSPDAEPVVLTVRRGLFIEGVLRNASGEPLYGYSISIVNQAGEGGLGATTDSEGRFRLGVEPGTTWTLTVSGPQGEAAFETLLVHPDVPGGTRDLELRLGR